MVTFKNKLSPWLVTLLVFGLPLQTSSHWWFMSQVFALGAKVMCDTITGLVSIQRQLCHENPDVMVSVGKGAKLGVEECQYQFKHKRWNCSTVARDATVFGKVMRRASRETAFVYSVSSAGVVHEVTRSCSLGELKDCSCANRRGRHRKGFQWGGCSDNIAYGLNFAKQFVDSREVENDARALMNLHNNFVGRRAVKSLSALDCKCHGVSGSCQVKTCWKTMSPFRLVGDYLRRRYDDGIQVTVDQSGHELVLVDSRYPPKPARDDLVFLEESPDYCVPDHRTGSLGTGSRECNRTLTGVGGCEVLCCGRGFNTIQVEKNYKCSCKFHWCCYVKCQSCRKKMDIHVCKNPEDVRSVPAWHRAEVSVSKTFKRQKNKKKKGNKKGKKRRNKNKQLSGKTNKENGVDRSRSL